MRISDWSSDVCSSDLADAAIEALWSTSLPRDPSGALQNHLSRLRKGLPDGLIESLGDGYRLDPALVEVDCDRLAALVSDSSAPSEQVELDYLIDRWRGPASPELVDPARSAERRVGEGGDGRVISGGCRVV